GELDPSVGECVPVPLDPAEKLGARLEALTVTVPALLLCLSWAGRGQHLTPLKQDSIQQIRRRARLWGETARPGLSDSNVGVRKQALGVVQVLSDAFWKLPTQGATAALVDAGHDGGYHQRPQARTESVLVHTDLEDWLQLRTAIVN
ncbi:MAG TPA: hypothetical protein VIM73_08070, partial [Polyangiaceae bacterium]